jgi:ABC-type phosphate transport system substrate-binding protein
MQERQMRLPCLGPGLIAALLGISIAAPPSGAQAAIAVIVSSNSPIADLSMEQLRRIYLGSTTTFPGVGAVILVEHPPEREAFYRAALGMTEDRVKRHWIRVVFAGDDAAPPKEIDDPGAVSRFVADHPAAIAFITVSAVQPEVKVVTIDGRRPGDADYPLR